jgi:hypothetical protein
MAKTRNSAGDHSNMSSVYKPIISYAKTVAGAAADFGSAWKDAFNKGADPTPGADARARAANARFDAEKGQLVGAILQGRKYNNKTGKQIKK